MHCTGSTQCIAQAVCNALHRQYTMQCTGSTQHRAQAVPCRQYDTTQTVLLKLYRHYHTLPHADKHRLSKQGPQAVQHTKHMTVQLQAVQTQHATTPCPSGCTTHQQHAASFGHASNTQQQTLQHQVCCLRLEALGTGLQ
jgi:hypothetical protein